MTIKQAYWKWLCFFNSEFKYADNDDEVNTCDIVTTTLIATIMTLGAAFLVFVFLSLLIAPIVGIVTQYALGWNYTEKNATTAFQLWMVSFGPIGAILWVVSLMALGTKLMFEAVDWIVRNISEKLYKRRIEKEAGPVKHSLAKDLWNTVTKKMCINIKVDTFK